MKKILSIIFMLILGFILTSCTFYYDLEPKQELEWVVYWYLSAGELENNGITNSKLEELCKNSLPENVKVIIQTGNNEIERFEYSGDELKSIEKLPLKDMAFKDTFVDFLNFAKINYPSKKTMLCISNTQINLVDSVLSYDNSLSLADFNQAISTVFGTNDKPPIEIILFDTPVGANIELAKHIKGLSKYMISAQYDLYNSAVNYEGLTFALSDKHIDSLDLAKEIVYANISKCKGSDITPNGSISVIDIQKLDNLLEEYNKFAYDILKLTLSDTNFVAKLMRIADKSQNFGLMTQNTDYSNMLDIKDFALNIKEETNINVEKLLKSIDNCVIHNLKIGNLINSNGISCYFPYSSNKLEVKNYMDLEISENFNLLYTFLFNFDLTDYQKEYLSTMGYVNLPEINYIKSTNWENIKPNITNDNKISLKLDNSSNILTDINYEVYYHDKDKSNQYLLLSTNGDIKCDWENETFKVDFINEYLTFDGKNISMSVNSQMKNYKKYSFPVIVNDEQFIIHIIRNLSSDEYIVEGVSKAEALYNTDVIKLGYGDKLKPLLYAAPKEHINELQSFTDDTIIYFDNLKIEKLPIHNEDIYLRFKMRDYLGNTAYSDFVKINN